MPYTTPQAVCSQIGKPSLVDDPRVIAVCQAATDLIDDWCGNTESWPDNAVPPTVQTVALSLAVDLWKQPDATFGMLGSAETGMVRIARDLLNRYDSLLIPYYNGIEGWGVA